MREFSEAVTDFLGRAAMHPHGDYVTSWTGAVPAPPPSGGALSDEIVALLPPGCRVSEAGERVLVMRRCAQGVGGASFVAGDRAALLWPLLKVETGFLLVTGFADAPSGDPDALLDPSWAQRTAVTASGWWPAGFPGEGGVRNVHCDTSAPGGDLWLGWALPRPVALDQMHLFGAAAFTALPALTGRLFV